MAFGQVADCSHYNTALIGPFPKYATDRSEHSSGGHFFNNSVQGSCTYSGTASASGPVGCAAVAQASSTTQGGDTGTLSPLLKRHQPSVGDAQGMATTNLGGAASAQSMGHVAYESCYLCISSGSVSFNSVTGVIEFSKPPLWADSLHYSNTWAIRSLQSRLFVGRRVSRYTLRRPGRSGVGAHRVVAGQRRGPGALLHS